MEHSCEALNPEEINTLELEAYFKEMKIERKCVKQPISKGFVCIIYFLEYIQGSGVHFGSTDLKITIFAPEYE